MPAHPSPSNFESNSSRPASVRRPAPSAFPPAHSPPLPPLPRPPLLATTATPPDSAHSPRFLLSLIIFGRRFIVPTLTLSFRAVRSCTCAARKPRNLHCRDLPPQHPLAHHGRRQTNKAASQTYRCRLIPLLEFSEKPEASKFKHQMRKHAQNGKFRVAQTCPERSRMGPSPARVSIRHVFRRAESHQKNLCLEALGSAATVREPHSLCS